MPEVRMRVDAGSFEALKRIRNHIDTYPNRIASAQQSAMLETIRELGAKLMRHGNAAYYLDYDVYQYGPVGLRLRIGPSKTDRKGKDGYSTKMATKILLTGRRGGKVYRKAQGKFKLRPGSVQDGYPKYLSEFKLGRIQSKRDVITKDAKQLMIDNLMKAYRRQGFGVRGGAQNITADTRPRR